MQAKIIEDFLPPPEKLCLKEENVKVTISLSKSSVNFFKEYATQNKSHYQTMIREVVDGYVGKYKK